MVNKAKRKYPRYAVSTDAQNWTSTLVKNGVAGVYVGENASGRTNKYRQIAGPFDITSSSTTTPTTSPPTTTPPTTPPPTPTTLNILGKLAVVNASSESDADVQKWVNACKKQADNDISKYWAYSIDVEFVAKGQTIPQADIYCGILNNSEEAGVLGWHDYMNNTPSIKIFTAEARKYGLQPSVTISHEFAELIGDVDCNTTVNGYDENGKACMYFRENCDPVEADNLGYQIDSVQVSDFITPTWFQQNGKAPFDFMSKCSQPYQILKGGYMLVSYDNGSSWKEIDRFSKAAEMHRGPGSRFAIYKKLLKGEKLKENEIKPGMIAGGTLFQQGKL